MDLSDYLARTSEVTVPPLFPPILSDSDGSDDADNSTNLMEELVRLSRKQLNDAAPAPVSPVDHHASEKRKTKKHNVGVMSGPSVTSKGVTASLDPSVSHGSNTTVFLDLRKQEEQAPPQVSLVYLHVYGDVHYPVH